MRTPHSCRAGLTLVEVLVALLLFSTAALTTAAVHGATSRLASEAVIRRILADRAASVFDSIRSIPCATVSSGTHTSSQGSLRWTVSRAQRVISVDLRATPAVGKPWTAATAIPC